MADIVPKKNKDAEKKSTPDLLSSSRGKFAAERRRKFKFWATVWTVVFVAFIVGIIFLLRIEKIRIHNITVSETKVIDPVAVREHVQAHINGMYVWVIPKNSVFLLPLKSIHADLEHNFPYAKTVTVRRVGLESIAVDITERKGVYLWCVDHTNTSCSFMDSDGYVFAQAPYFSGDVYTRFYGDRTTNTNNTGSYLTVEKMNNINNLFGLLVKHEFVPVSFELGTGKSILTVKKNEHSLGMLLVPNFVASDVDHTVGTLLTNTDFTNSIEKLATIDLRFGNKIFYTYKGDKVEMPVTVAEPVDTASTITDTTTKTQN